MRQGYIDHSGVDGLTIGALKGQSKITSLACHTIEHQGVCGAVAGKVWIGTNATSVYREGRAQIFAANVNGGRFAVLNRLHLDTRDHRGKVSGATAGAEQHRQSQSGPELERVENLRGLHSQILTLASPAPR